MEQYDERTWFDPRTGDQVSLTYIGLVPDLPAGLDELPLLRHRLALETAEVGALIEAHVVFIDKVPALYQLLKVPIPDQDSGQAFIAAFTVPKATCSAVLRIQCAEGPTTGVREATVFGQVGVDNYVRPHPYAPDVAGRLPWHVADDAQWDGQFPDHPLSRARAWAHRTMATARIDPAFARLPPFRPGVPKPEPAGTNGHALGAGPVEGARKPSPGPRQSWTVPPPEEPGPRVVPPVDEGRSIWQVPPADPEPAVNGRAPGAGGRHTSSEEGRFEPFGAEPFSPGDGGPGGVPSPGPRRRRAAEGADDAESRGDAAGAELGLGSGSGLDLGTADAGVADTGFAEPRALDLGVSDLGVVDFGAPDFGADSAAPGRDIANADPGTATPGATGFDAGTKDPGATDFDVVNPGAVDPGTISFAPARPGVMRPGATDFRSASPGSGDLDSTDFGTSRPDAADPRFTGENSGATPSARDFGLASPGPTDIDSADFDAVSPGARNSHANDFASGDPDVKGPAFTEGDAGAPDMDHRATHFNTVDPDTTGLDPADFDTGNPGAKGSGATYFDAASPGSLNPGPDLNTGNPDAKSSSTNHFNATNPGSTAPRPADLNTKNPDTKGFSANHFNATNPGSTAPRPAGLNTGNPDTKSSSANHFNATNPGSTGPGPAGFDTGNTDTRGSGAHHFGSASPGSKDPDPTEFNTGDSGATQFGPLSSGAIDPGVADFVPADPGLMNPDATDSGTANPGISDRGATSGPASHAKAPDSTDVGPMDPGTANPDATDPGLVEPGANLRPVDPGTTNPDPGAAKLRVIYPGTTNAENPRSEGRHVEEPMGLRDPDAITPDLGVATLRAADTPTPTDPIPADPAHTNPDTSRAPLPDVDPLIPGPDAVNPTKPGIPGPAITRLGVSDLVSTGTAETTDFEPADGPPTDPVPAPDLPGPLPTAAPAAVAPPVSPGDVMHTVLVGLPIGGYLPLWQTNEITYWRMTDPDVVRDRLGVGLESRSEVDNQRFREAAMLSPDKHTLFLMDRFRDRTGRLGGTTTQLVPATEDEAHAAADDKAMSELYRWLGEVVLAAADRDEFVAVETGGWHVPQDPMVLIMLRTDGEEWHSVVETSPVPVGAPVWRDQQPVDGDTQLLVSPATEQTLRAAGLLTRFAVGTWPLHPFQLGLSFGPNPTLGEMRTGKVNSHHG